MDDERLALAPVSRALIFARHSRAGGNPPTVVPNETANRLHPRQQAQWHAIRGRHLQPHPARLAAQE